MKEFLFFSFLMQKKKKKPCKEIQKRPAILF